METTTPQSNELVVVDHPPQALAVSSAMRLDDILAQVKLIQDVMHRVMKEKEHYGTIPGCGDKKTLLQPGAQKLTMTFRLAPAYEIQEVNLERGHKEYRVICTLKSIQSGSFVGQGVGCCSTMESKYRWRGGSLKCPKCGKETIRKDKKPNGGWYCWAKLMGCGANFAVNDETITKQETGKVENDNPADCYNTVLKIAKKRAFVDATITATAASDIFTQDVGDDESVPTQEPPRSEYIPDEGTTESFKEVGPPNDTTPPPKTSPTPKSSEKEPVVGPKYRLKILNRLQAAPGQPHRGLVEGYLRSKLWITGEQSCEDFPLEQLPRDADEFLALGEAIQRFETTMRQEVQP